jgi:hypothetical protein
VSFKGKQNRYTCQQCGKHIITVDTDEGTTPFMIGCRATVGCKGHMHSSFYSDAVGTPTYEWRKPTYTEFAKSSRAMQQHFEMGGLDIHRLERKP